MMFAVIFVVAFAAGAINSVAGGGTLLTFPILIAYGIPAVVANATSTVALVPGSFGAFWGFRKDSSTSPGGDVKLIVVSALGGFVGAAALLRVGNDAFAKLVPWLILSATGLFIAQEPLRRLSARAGDAPEPGDLGPAALFVQLLVAIYGGFFGAGSGILMLGVYGLLGYRDINRMNRMKNLANVGFNAAASVTFIVGRQVDWTLASSMLVGAVIGGYGGAGVAKKIGQKNVKRVVVVVGLSMGILTLVRRV
jgi:uncharacterized membrane protein YfcA